MPRLSNGIPVDDPLDAVIDAYLAARQAGREPDRRALVRAHPALADELEQFFADHDEMDRLTRPLRDVAQAARLDDDADRDDGPDGRLPIPVEFGDYVLLEVLGAGGMGIVYRAHHRALGRDVALKMILAGALADEAGVRRFRNEAEAAAALRHPNIVAIHDVGVHDGRHFLTMDLIDGGSLAEREGPFRDDPREAVRLISIVAGAVRHAHERGILHRDLKPSNILLDGGGRPHVTDFGLARRIGDESTLTESGAIVGSPPYMSPEQAGGRIKEVTTRTDVYGLGAVLYTLLAGRPPFRGDSPLETMDKVRSDPPESPRRINPRVDRDLETICLKCLEKEPDRRYPSAEAVGEDLERWLSGRPIRARRAGRLRRAVLWARRRPYATALLVGVAVALAAGSGLVLSQWRAAESARRALEVALYENRIALADRELAGGEPSHAMELLEECPPALRGWEWYHLRHRRRFEEAIPAGNLTVMSVAYHPGGRVLATGHGMKLITIWEPGEGRMTPVRTIEAHEFAVPSLAFTTDGRRLVSVSLDGTAKVWDVDTWRLRSALEGKPVGGIWCLALHPDGRRIALAGFNKVVGLWDPDSDTLRVLGGHGDRVTGVAFDPEGRLLASSSDDATVRLWEVATGREVRTLRDPSLFAFTCVAFSPDGRSLAAGNNGGALTLWETATGRRIYRRVHQAATIRRLAFSPDGRRIATAGGEDRGVTIWDAASGRDLLSLFGHPGEVWGVAFRGDGQGLASVGLSRLRVWDAPRREDDETPGVRVLRGHSERVNALAFSPDGRRIATASWDRTVRVWEPGSGRSIATWLGPAGALDCVAFGPDGGLAASGRDRVVTIWDAGGRMMRSPIRHERNVRCLAFSHDGRWLASGAEDRSVQLWDTTGPVAATSRTLKFSGFIYSLAFSPDDAHLALVDGERLVIYEIAAPRVEHAWNVRAGQRIGGLAYSPDGRSLAFATQTQGIQVWDPTTGVRVREIRDHDGEVLAVAYSPDGRYLASGGMDRTLRIRDASDGSAVQVFRDGVGEIRGLAFSPDGRYLAATNGDNTVTVRDLVRNPLPGPGQEAEAVR